jgi:uncharacterized membrane protein
MESIFLETIKLSPMLGILLIIWFYQRKDSREQQADFNKLVQDTNNQHKEREKELRETVKTSQEIIQRNQCIMQELSQNFGVIKDVSEDVKSIKVDMTIMKNDVEDLKRK